jgi:DnaJ-class molecular chaperone
MNDPYHILGVNKNSSLEEIKVAYKKLARKYHPDLNPGKKESEDKFKEVANAFDLIGTAEARSKFDSGETDGQKQKQYDEYMKSQGKRRGPTYKETQDKGGRYSYEYAAGMDDDIFSSLFGKNKSYQYNSGSDYPGEDELYQLEISFYESAVGAQKDITLPNGKKLQIQIPGGITSGQKLKFKGQGKPGIGTGASGDLFIQISVSPSEQFKREGKDIVSEVSISFFEAINGGDVEVDTVDGKIMLKIPAGVTTGTRVRIKGKGAGKLNERGYHYALIKVVMPKDPSVEFKESMALLEKQFNYNPRNHV